MPLTDAVLQALGNELNTNHLLFASLHTADPGATGINESTAGRQQVDFNVSAGGDLTLTVTENFTGGAASGACTHVGLWTLATGGTFKGGFALTGDQTFNAAGEYDVTGITINLTAT